jgi:hypothetical protein
LGERRPGPPATPLALGATIRNGWELFTASWGSLTGLFLAIYVPLFLLRGIVFSVVRPEETAELVAATSFVFIEFVLPSLGASVAVAASAVLIASRTPAVGAAVGRDNQSPPLGVRSSLASLAPSAREIVAAAMVSVMLAMASFLVGLHQILLPLFFGPPVLIHVIALERISFQEAWTRMKELLKGNWIRALLYLLIVALGISIVHNVALLGLLYAFEAQGITETAAVFLLGGPVAGVTRGLTLPLLAAIAMAVYVQLREQGPGESSAR